jgi:DNA-binding XRE family transcriptional regulator
MAKRDQGDALLKALQHPLRRSLLRHYVESEAVGGLGPKELALALKAPLSKVGYRVRELARLGAVQIVREAPARGSIAHFYEATPLVKETPWVLATLGLGGGRMGRKRGLAATEFSRCFGENLVELRGRVALSQMGVAERADLDRSEINLLEHGRRVPRLDTVLKLAGAFEVQPCELLAGMAWKLNPSKRGPS